MNTNPLRKLEALGQSVWLDLLRRGLVSSGDLQHLIDEDGLSGATSNPSIFEKAILGSQDYEEDIRRLAHEGRGAAEIYEILTTDDLRRAADVFRPVYDRTDGRDGFVSIEVSPHLAHDTRGTVEEASRLWGEIDRPNLMVKVPATAEGLPAIRQLTAEGVNVNITLLFGLERYRGVIEAYLSGLEARVHASLPIPRIASVASFFVSRIDVLIDPQLEKVEQVGGANAELARSLRGQTAVANARMAYQIYRQEFSGRRFKTLRERGARTQRLLWASTSTKNPHYSDVKYVEALIGAETIDTMPLETLHAYRDHGKPALRIEKDLDDARRTLEHLSDMNIDLDQVTQRLEDEGAEKFIQAYDAVLAAIEATRQRAGVQ